MVILPRGRGVWTRLPVRWLFAASQSCDHWVKAFRDETVRGTTCRTQLAWNVNAQDAP